MYFTDNNSKFTVKFVQFCFILTTIGYSGLPNLFTTLKDFLLQFVGIPQINKYTK